MLEYGYVFCDQPSEFSDERNEFFYAYMHKLVIRHAERVGGRLVEGPPRVVDQFPPRDAIRLAWPMVREVPDVRP